MEPVLNRILTAIESRIAVSNLGFTICIVRDGRVLDQQTIESLPKISSPDRAVLIQQMHPVPAPELNRHGNPPSVGFRVQINVHRFVKPDGSAEKDYVLALNQAAADIVKLVTQPASQPGQWHSMDGNAIITTIGAARFVQPGGAFQHGIAVPFVVSYRVAENDHTEAR